MYDLTQKGLQIYLKLRYEDDESIACELYKNWQIR